MDSFAFIMDIVDMQREHKLWPGKTVSVHLFHAAYYIWVLWNVKITKMIIMIINIADYGCFQPVQLIKVT